MLTVDEEFAREEDEVLDECRGSSFSTSSNSRPKLRPGRQNNCSQPGQPSSQSNILSVVSRQYDTDKKGFLDPAQQRMRDLDTSNRGYLPNDKVYDLVKESVELHRKVFNLKRIVAVLVLFLAVLTVAVLGASFAAATMAKDSSVRGDAMITRDGSSMLGTKGKVEEYDLTGGGNPAARRLGVAAAALRRALVDVNAAKDDGIYVTTSEKDAIVADETSRLLRRCACNSMQWMDVSTGRLTVVPAEDLPNDDHDSYVWYDDDERQNIAVRFRCRDVDGYCEVIFVRDCACPFQPLTCMMSSPPGYDGGYCVPGYTPSVSTCRYDMRGGGYDIEYKCAATAQGPVWTSAELDPPTMSPSPEPSLISSSMPSDAT